MSTTAPHEGNWYTRRAGIERGPFSEQRLARYILLGRVQLSDELRCGEEPWVRVSDCEGLVPEELKLPQTPENRQRLLEARLAADERAPGDRRARGPEPSAEVLERRSGIERRQPEPDAVIRFREMREVGNGSPVTVPARPMTLHHRLVIAAALLAGLLLLVWATSSAS